MDTLRTVVTEAWNVIPTANKQRWGVIRRSGPVFTSEELGKEISLERRIEVAKGREKEYSKRMATGDELAGLIADTYKHMVERFEKELMEAVVVQRQSTGPLKGAGNDGSTPSRSSNKSEAPDGGEIPPVGPRRYKNIGLGV